MCSCSTKGRASLVIEKQRQRKRWAEEEAANRTLPISYTHFVLPPDSVGTEQDWCGQLTRLLSSVAVG